MRERAPGLQYMSFDDFEELLADKPAHERWELIGGRVVKLMVGARWEHNFIIQNLSSAIRERLRATGSSCRTLTETFFFKDVRLQSALLPDVIVRCGPFAPGATSLDDPVVVAEVLSVGSEARDRFEKWAIYQRVPSLRHYALVSRDKAHIEVIDRASESWSGFRVLDGLDAVLPLGALGLEVPLAEIYRDVIEAG
jgi:Uma2 family endonuclease